jgi:hypothetical protein
MNERTTFHPQTASSLVVASGCTYAHSKNCLNKNKKLLETVSPADFRAMKLERHGTKTVNSCRRYIE